MLEEEKEDYCTTDDPKICHPDNFHEIKLKALQEEFSVDKIPTCHELLLEFLKKVKDDLELEQKKQKRRWFTKNNSINIEYGGKTPVKLIPKETESIIQHNIDLIQNMK